MEENNRQQVQRGYFLDLLDGLFCHRHLLCGDPISGQGVPELIIIQIINLILWKNVQSHKVKRPQAAPGSRINIRC
jgi:hypothetical protein